MTLETAGHGSFDNPTGDTVRSELASLNTGDNDFATLSGNEGFIQTATTGGGFMLEYRDASGYFGSADEAIPLAQVQDAFAHYLAGDQSWKAQFQWNAREDGAAGQSGTGASAGAGSGNPADSLVGTLKNEALRLARKKLRGLFRG